MSNSQNNSQTANTKGFLKLPFTLLQRTDLTLPEKVLLGYIYTRSNVKRTDGQPWTISSPDIVNVTGLSKSVVNRLLKTLTTASILTFLEMRIGEGHPFKVYAIDRQLLSEYMGLRPQEGLTKTPGGSKSVGTETQPDHLEEDKGIEEDILEEKSTKNYRDTQFALFNIAVDNLKVPKGSPLYDDLFRSLAKEYNIPV